LAVAQKIGAFALLNNVPLSGDKDETNTLFTPPFSFYYDPAEYVRPMIIRNGREMYDGIDFDVIHTDKTGTAIDFYRPPYPQDFLWMNNFTRV